MTLDRFKDKVKKHYVKMNTEKSSTNESLMFRINDTESALFNQIVLAAFFIALDEEEVNNEQR